MILTVMRPAPPVTIRPLTEPDVEAVIDVLEIVGGEGRWIGLEAPFDRQTRAETMRRDLTEAATFGGFVATQDGSVVGAVYLRLAPYGVATLAMAIIAPYRGRGVGTLLVDQGLEWARRAEAHKVSLEVWPHNDRAIGLYKKFGFVEEGRLLRHYRRRSGELWDAVVMGLLLEPGA
jgi:RimJ/RimL family protein N-acetyltransferase